MVKTVIYLLFNVLYIYAVYCFINNFLYKKRVTNGTIFCSCLSYYCVLTFVFFTLSSSSINFITNLSFCLLLSFLYNASNLKRILATVFIYILMFASDQLTMIILSLISNLPHAMITGGSNLGVLGIPISMTLSYLLVKLVNPLFNKERADLLFTYWAAVFLIPSSSIYILYSLNRQYKNGHLQNMSFILVTVCIILAINILVFYLYTKLIKDEALKYENNLLQQQNEAYENQALLIKEFQDNLHAQKHDMNGYFSIIKKFAELNQCDSILNYVSTLILNTQNIETSFSSGDIVIDAMINSKLYLAKRQDTIR